MPRDTVAREAAARPRKSPWPPAGVTALNALQEIDLTVLRERLRGLLVEFPDVRSLAVVGDIGEPVCAPEAPPPAFFAALDALLQVADRAASDIGEEDVRQVVVDTGTATVAALRESGRRLFAVTASRPRSLGLLLYELRTLPFEDEALPDGAP